MPNVPALILDGELDLRTPVENGARSPPSCRGRRWSPSPESGTT
jgi:hypothetical protein